MIEHFELRNYPYDERRMDFFKQKRLEAKRRVEHWQKRVPKVPYNSIQYEKACDAADEYLFYNDVIVLLGGEDGEKD